MENQSEKRKGLVGVFIIAGIALLLIAMCASLCLTAQPALVKERDSRFHRARILLCAWGVLVSLRDEASYDQRKAALDAAPSEWVPALERLSGIAEIELLLEEPEKTPPRAIPPEYLGGFEINAAGNNGILYIGMYKGYLVGSVRFPGWGKGAIEPLKGVRIDGDAIYFTRSVSTPEEAMRTGSTLYFIQNYSGRYGRNGTVIHGFYTIQGARKPWEAHRKR